MQGVGTPDMRGVTPTRVGHTQYACIPPTRAGRVLPRAHHLPLPSAFLESADHLGAATGLSLAFEGVGFDRWTPRWII